MDRIDTSGKDCCHGFYDHDFHDDRGLSYDRQHRLDSPLCGGRGVLVPRDWPAASQRVALAIRLVRWPGAMGGQRDVGLPRLDLGTI
ncbi:MAG: hypothetical protein GXP28_08415 [Planctomycetes bacterium]|nr:hypothetical protein [Planctomycetota bacterium]